MEGLLSILPFVLIFAICPVMMLFMHRGQGNHAMHGDHAMHGETPTPAARLVDEVKKT